MENLTEDAECNPLALLYRKDDVLPIDDWHLRKMNVTAMTTYCQMVAMTEPMLKESAHLVVQTVWEICDDAADLLHHVAMGSGSDS